MLDAAAVVEGDNLQRRLAGLQFLAPSATLVMKERTLKCLIGTVAFGAVPGSIMPSPGRVGDAVGAFHPEAVELAVEHGDPSLRWSIQQVPYQPGTIMRTG